MERTLNKCIKYIRFFQIPAQEYFYKVRPYKKILPRELKEDLQLFHIVPLGQPKFTTVLPPRMANDWRQTSESFIFSLNKEHKTTIISRVRNPNCAIRDTVSKQWIGFGVGDLHFLDGTCSPSDYETKILDTTRYVVEDFEVFQILTKC
ncbi:6741_t:CDS:2, partial [Scutellospora calospora]